MILQGTSDAIFVTSGDYTREAWLFAKDNGLALLDGPNLIELIDYVRSDETTGRQVPAVTTELPVLVFIAIIGGSLWIDVLWVILEYRQARSRRHL
jgi:hypothetical protein